MNTDMTKAAVAGFSGETCGWYFSSPLWLAHEAGKALAAAGHSAPTGCVMGNGYSVKVVNGNGGFKVKFHGYKLEKALVVAL